MNSKEFYIFAQICCKNIKLFFVYSFYNY